MGWLGWKRRIAVAAVVGLVFVGFFLDTAFVAAFGQQPGDLTTPTPLAEGDTLVIGFLGGRDSWNDDRRSVRKLALQLRQMRLPGVHVETFENTRRELALDFVRDAFDRDRDGTLSAEERAKARLLIYGQSFGGAAVVKFARQLEELGVPVRLTVQVDSVGLGDAVIPPNVRRAANLFQRNGWFIRGEQPIQAADPAHTEILGNFEYDYSEAAIDLSDVPFWKKAFRYSHTRMEHDPAVWAKVQSLLLQYLPQPANLATPQ